MVYTLGWYSMSNWNYGLVETTIHVSPYCGSAGHVSQEAVARYIAEQQGKDVFEYSIFGDPTGQTKIGDFS